MGRLTKAEAREILRSELAEVGYDVISAFQIEEGARPGSENLDWWHENTPVNERSETRRSQGYLRAYLRIAGDMPMYAGGLLLEKSDYGWIVLSSAGASETAILHLRRGEILHSL